MASDDKVTLTEGEMRILKAIFAHMNSKPDVDWDAAASAASLGNAKSLKERYRQMCVRLGWNNKGAAAAAAAASSSNPVTPKKTKASPSKVVKRSGGGRKRKAEVADDEGEDEDEDQKPVVAASGLIETGEF
ncbi:hypothetical protein PWT90_10945 [Aphanocladium album]|nr:hypothetical protein PWT90_10945 [Aphanocladium album]